MTDFTNARKDFCVWLGIDIKLLNTVLDDIEEKDLYKLIFIPKKSGGFREINAPCDDLLEIQKKLYEKILKIRTKHFKGKEHKLKISHGFEKGKNIITNAKIHKGKRTVINLDIKDFFPSFHFVRVQGFFHKNKMFKFSEERSRLIAELTTHKSCLPQGAPTSPLIANLIFSLVDIKIYKVAKKYRMNYTRYADDLTFSTNDKKIRENFEDFKKDIIKALKDYGFELNDKKTRMIFNDSRQDVTGLTVNEKINVPRKFSDDTRAMVNSLFKRGFYFIDKDEEIIGRLNQLEGRLSFINQLDWYNNKFDHEFKKVKIDNKFKANLYNRREVQYRNFLFYKYFYAPDKVTIVTEGKTDIIHIKAALKHYYDDYPNLISKDGSKFRFNIYFLKRSKRLDFFLGFAEGGHTFINIYKIYKKNNPYNIYEHINGKRKRTLIRYGNDALNTNKYNFLERKDEDFKKIIEKVKKDNLNKELDEKDYYYVGIRLLERMYNVKDIGLRKPVILLFDNEKKDNSPLKEFNKATKVNLGIGGYCKKIFYNLYGMTYPLIKGKNEIEIEDLYDYDNLRECFDVDKFSREKDAGKSGCYGKTIFAKRILDNSCCVDFSYFKPILDQINDIASKKDGYFKDVY